MGDKMNVMRSNPDFRRERARLVDKVRPFFHADNTAATRGTEDQVVKDKAQVGFPGAHVGNDRIVRAFKQGFDRGPQQIGQMKNLF